MDKLINNNLSPEVLSQLALSDNKRVRCQALRDIGCKEMSERQVIIYYLGKDVRVYRDEVIFACDALARSGDRSDVEYLLPLTDSRSRLVAKHARDAINKILKK